METALGNQASAPCSDLLAMRAEIVELRQRVAALEAAVGIGARDDADRRLVIAITEHSEALWFRTADVMERGRLVPELGHALEDACIDSPKSLGRLLRRIERSPVDGIRIDRIDGRRGGVMWRCLQVSQV